MISAESLSPATDDTQRLFLAGNAATGTCRLTPNPWPLVRGGFISDPAVRWEIVGAPQAPLVAVLGGISADRHVTAHREDPSGGWWNRLVGPSRAIDTDRFRVLGIDYLYGSQDSDSTPPPAAAVDTRDQARALMAVLDELGEPGFHAMIGSSYGGMVALAAAASFADRVEQIVVISAAHRPHPQSTAWRSVQRRMVRFGHRVGDVSAAMEIARSLAMVTYRSPDELRQRFATQPCRATSDRSVVTSHQFPVEGYLRARGRDFAQQFSPRRFLALSESIDLHEVDPSSINVATTLVAVSSDQLIPVTEIEALGQRISGPASVVHLDSIYGHDAFLKETDAIAGVLQRCLDQEVTA